MNIKLTDRNGHASLIDFGVDKLNQKTDFDELLRELPPMRPTAIEVITRSCYQTEFGIYNHNQPTSHRPLALSALHDKENVIEGGPVFSYIRRFHRCRIAQHFNMSLQDFFALPVYIAELVCEIGEAEANDSDRTTSEIEKQLSLDV